jgi:hypothetical protein
MTETSALPERTRLFHVGIPKSGTTSLQVAAAANRRDLLRQGVLYPGDKVNQRGAVLGFMGRSWGWDKGGAKTPPQKRWDALMAEIEADESRRVFFGHEFAAEANKETARGFVESIGERCHVLITLRSFGAILPSAWQQFVKAGTTTGFDDWLRAVLADPPDRSVTRRFHRRNDQGGVVRRWVKAAGADRVTVIVTDSHQPELLTNGIEQLLALRPGTLAADDPDGFAANRGLTTAEAELFLALNRAIEPYDVDWDDYERIVRFGAQRRLMEEPPSAGDRLMLPDWAARRAAERGAEFAEQIAASGVRIIGDLSALADKPSSRQPAEPVEKVPVDMAAEALAGMLSAGAGRGPDFEPPEPESELADRMTRVRARRVAWITASQLFARLRAALKRGFARGRAAVLPASGTGRGR